MSDQNLLRKIENKRFKAEWDWKKLFKFEDEWIGEENIILVIDLSCDLNYFPIRGWKVKSHGIEQSGDEFRVK